MSANHRSPRIPLIVALCGLVASIGGIAVAMQVGVSAVWRGAFAGFGVVLLVYIGISIGIERRSRR